MWRRVFKPRGGVICRWEKEGKPRSSSSSCTEDSSLSTIDSRVVLPPVPVGLTEPVKSGERKARRPASGSSRGGSPKGGLGSPLGAGSSKGAGFGHPSPGAASPKGGLGPPPPSGSPKGGGSPGLKDGSPKTPTPAAEIAPSPPGGRRRSVERLVKVAVAAALDRKVPRRDDFEMVRTIGTGTFGRVFLARRRAGGAIVAIKRLSKRAVMKMKQVEHVESEKAILERVTHPFVIRLEGTFQDARHLYIVMEFVIGGEFFTYLRRAKRLEDGVARFYAAQVVLLFEYLHGQRIVYRDLKPENLLIARNGYLKLTDFGFAKCLDGGRTYTLCGTPEYIAPEILLNKGHGLSVDWWALGIFIYEMVVGYPPFFDEDALGIYQKILSGNVVFPRLFPKDAKSLVKHLLVHNPVHRMGHVNKDGLSDVRAHRWFKNLPLDQLLLCALSPPYVPHVEADDDACNFGKYDEDDDADDDELDAPDPFAAW